MTCPKPPFTGTISACEDLAAQVAAAVAGEYGPAGFVTVDEVLAALLQGGQIREEWGYRLTYNDGHIRERWVGSSPTDREIAEKVCQSPLNWAEPGRPGQLIRRFVITTAAEVVP